MLLRKIFIVSITNTISKLCRLLYRKTDKTSLDFCLLKDSGFKSKYVISESVECPNLTKVTIVISNVMDLPRINFQYLSSERELIVIMNSFKVNKEFLKHISQITNKQKLYSDEVIFEFYLNLISSTTEIIESKEYVASTIDREKQLKLLFKEGSTGKKESVSGKSIIIRDPNLKTKD